MDVFGTNDTLNLKDVYLPILLLKFGSDREKVRIIFAWCTNRDSNPGPTGYEPVALTN